MKSEDFKIKCHKYFNLINDLCDLKSLERGLVSDLFNEEDSYFRQDTEFQLADVTEQVKIVEGILKETRKSLNVSKIPEDFIPF